MRSKPINKMIILLLFYYYFITLLITYLAFFNLILYFESCLGSRMPEQMTTAPTPIHLDIEERLRLP